MGVEIERKFLTTGVGYRESGRARHYRQGYLSLERDRSVRIRSAGDRAWVTIKGPTLGITRREFEYEIPAADADELLAKLCHRPLIGKLRYTVEVAGREWTVDEFEGDNAGLVVAEVELPSAAESFVKPEWCGVEVSDDPRYANASLVRRPFSSW